MDQLRIPAVYMRGGTSKGLFFRAQDLPSDPSVRDQILLRAVGSPDPYGKQIDGMGGATSSTSKVVIVSPSTREDCDVDYLFGQVAIGRAFIDWSGNCGNLTAAVGPYAVSQGWINAPNDGIAEVRIWQANISKRILSRVPVANNQALEEGDFYLDGVAFPAAEVRLEFLEPGGLGDNAADSSQLFPTGLTVDSLAVPGVGNVEATLITAGNPTVFVDAVVLGLSGIELQRDINNNPALLAKCEAIRATAAVAMRLATTPEEASRTRLHTPKLAFVAPPKSYQAADGKPVNEDSIDINIRMLSMGQLHHAITGTGAIAAAVACGIPGTVPYRSMRNGADPLNTRLGHPSGVTAVGAEVTFNGLEWIVAKAVMSRSARRLMEGWVRVPAPAMTSRETN